MPTISIRQKKLKNFTFLWDGPIKNLTNNIKISSRSSAIRRKQAKLARDSGEEAYPADLAKRIDPASLAGSLDSCYVAKELPPSAVLRRTGRYFAE